MLAALRRASPRVRRCAADSPNTRRHHLRCSFCSLLVRSLLHNGNKLRTLAEEALSASAFDNLGCFGDQLLAVEGEVGFGLGAKMGGVN
jgi:hypothetical protein